MRIPQTLADSITFKPSRCVHNNIITFRWEHSNIEIKLLYTRTNQSWYAE